MNFCSYRKNVNIHIQNGLERAITEIIEHHNEPVSLYVSRVESSRRVHSTPEEFENAVSFLQLGLPSTLIPREDLQIDVSFSCVCLVIDHEFRHNIVKVAVDHEAIAE